MRNLFEICCQWHSQYYWALVTERGHSATTIEQLRPKIDWSSSFRSSPEKGTFSAAAEVVRSSYLELGQEKNNLRRDHWKTIRTFFVSRERRKKMNPIDFFVSVFAWKRWQWNENKLWFKIVQCCAVLCSVALSCLWLSGRESPGLYSKILTRKPSQIFGVE